MADTPVTPAPANPFDAIAPETEHVWFALNADKIAAIQAQLATIPNDKAVAILQAADAATEAGSTAVQVLGGIVKAALGAAKLIG